MAELATAFAVTLTRSSYLPIARTAPRRARRFVREACGAAALPVDMIEDASSVAAELARAFTTQTGLPVQLTVKVENGAVMVRMQDRSVTRQMPVVGATSRSLPVSRLFASWGFCQQQNTREYWVLLRPVAAERVAPAVIATSTVAPAEGDLAADAA
ncbi:hypothetical protein SAMN05892883_2378 [Jatrophihabitans sp. GAS493]|uniref:hypothetical protein n=1 Tax=Jatrophihabitans sp. GAS493 TaxID=1907575 RepID=UPI000BBF5932|nr:hypothetical protein [Jatrophihabitans sp. GAS493]SOD73080.1 hypothetical protein SAMN05892883_2378 [Jatrophihabitans sp. GAS493]